MIWFAEGKLYFRDYIICLLRSLLVHRLGCIALYKPCGKPCGAGPAVYIPFQIWVITMKCSGPKWMDGCVECSFGCWEAVHEDNEILAPCGRPGVGSPAGALTETSSIDENCIF